MELSLEPWKAPREKRFVFGQIVLAEKKDLTNIEAAPPGLLPGAAEADGGKGDVGHVGNLPPRRHRARYKGVRYVSLCVLL